MRPAIKYVFLTVVFLLFRHQPSVAEIALSPAECDSLLVNLGSFFPDTQKVETLINCCRIIRKNDIRASLRSAKKALGIAAACPVKWQVRAYSNLAYVYCEAREYDSAYGYFTVALRSVDTLHNPSDYSSALNGLGLIAREKGDYRTSLEYHEEALRKALEAGDTLSMIACYRLIGLAHDYLGDYENTIGNYLKAARLAEISHEDLEAAYTYNNISSYYIRKMEHSKALPYQLKAYDIIKKYNWKIDNFRMNNNLAIIYKELDDRDLALIHYNEALRIANDIGDKQLISTVLLNLSEYYRKLKLYRTAEGYGLESVRLAGGVKGEFNYTYLRASTALARLYMDMKHYEKSISLLDDAYELARRSGNLGSLKTITAQLSEVYENTGNYRLAFAYFKEYKTYSDSLLNEDKIKALTRLEMQYEFDKKEQETAFHNSQELQKRENELQHQKTMRNYAFLGLIASILIAVALFYVNRIRSRNKEQKLRQDLFMYMQRSLSQQMNPHFIFNTLNSIQYYIDRNERQEGMKYVSKFAQLMRIALYNSQHATVPIADEIEILELYADLEALRFPEPFELKIRIDEQIDTAQYQIPSFLLQPLVENAIRHGISAIEEKGVIEVFVNRSGNKIRCVVQDNGCGINGKGVMSAEDRMNGKHKSMATNLTQKRVGLLAMYYDLDLEFAISDARPGQAGNRGTRVELEIPLIQ